MKIFETKSLLKTDSVRDLFKELYQQDSFEIQLKRYQNLLDTYYNSFGDDSVEIFSSPGRVEIIGNHTDHNNGKVIAASIDMDCICVASKTTNEIIEINDVTYGERISINTSKLDNNDLSNSATLIKGMLVGFKQFGYNIGGFKACISSNVIPAAGLSSSASFEMLVCTIINQFYNNGELDVIACSKIGKFAENVYWNKQSGMLDQLGCAVGGVIAIDFKNNDNPLVDRMDCEIFNKQYGFVVVNTGKSHANLNEEYSSIPIEMKNIAQTMSKEVCRDVTLEDIRDNFVKLREMESDRAILRALHYITENIRVNKAIEAIRTEDSDLFVKLINESGNSSWKWLQNCYSVSNVNEQGIPIALALSELYFQEKNKCASRIHGGGFAGVILTVLPIEDIDEYINYMSKYFGTSNVYNVHIRKYGAICINKLL